MKHKRSLVAMLLIAVVLLMASQAQAAFGLRSFYGSVTDEKDETVRDACTMTVYTVDTHSSATVYSDDNKTAIGTTLQGVVTGDFQFWGSAASYDIVVTKDDGTGSFKIKGVTPPVERYIMPYSGYANILRTRVISVGHPGETGTDFAFTSAANTTQQLLDLGPLIPPYARVLDVTVICTQTVTASTMTFDVGNAGDGAQWVESSTAVDALGETVSMDAAGAFNVAISSSLQDVYLNGTPGANWENYLAGEWFVIITYLDIGSLYTSTGSVSG